MKTQTNDQLLRQRNFAKLVRERYGSNIDAAKALGLSNSQVSDYARGSRNMGEKLARRIELAAGLPAGSLSKQLDFGVAENIVNFPTLSDTVDAGSTKGRIYVQSYAAFTGKSEQEDVFMSVPTTLLSKLGLNVDSVKSLIMPDESQSSRIRQGDKIAINISWDKSIRNNVTYALEIGGVYTLRKAEFLPTRQLLLKCRNSSYTDVSISEFEIDNLKIIGEVITFEPASLSV